MPAYIKTPAQENKWQRARAQVDKQYGPQGITPASGEQYWKLVSHIYFNIEGTPAKPDYKALVQDASQALETPNATDTGK